MAKKKPTAAELQRKHNIAKMTKHDAATSKKASGIAATNAALRDTTQKEDLARKKQANKNRIKLRAKKKTGSSGPTSTGTGRKVTTKPGGNKSVRKPKKKSGKTNPATPAATAVRTEPPKTYSVTNLSGFVNQEQELLNAYIAMAGTELFQYVNSQTIDGMYNDVAIINVLSRRRQQYTPNRLIELAQIFVKGMWIEDGNLCIDIEDLDNKWGTCVLSLQVMSDTSLIAKTVN